MCSMISFFIFGVVFVLIDVKIIAVVVIVKLFTASSKETVAFAELGRY